MMFSLSGKKALITGASSGIGRSIALAFYNQGAEIVVSGRNGNALNQLAQECGKEKVYPLISDISKQEEAESLVDKAAEMLSGQIDILVCCAGMVRDNLILRMTQEEWDEVIQVNLRSAFIINQKAIKLMFKKKWGRIINVSSIVGVAGGAGQSNYAASKAGLVAMSKSLALEVASRNITVNCIAPGYIYTPMTENLSDARKEQILSLIPSKKIGTPDDVSGSVVFLASDEASYITGNTIHINSGMLMI